jgi:hypothetical protein
MTRKDFEMIASTLKNSRFGDDEDPLSPGAEAQWSTTCLAFASMLASTNPRFDRARFLAACGME